jgi:hypothetical protein
MKLREVAAKLPMFPSSALKFQPRSGSYQKSEYFLNLYKIPGCIIAADGTISKTGNVDLRRFKGQTLPVRFGSVSGDFDVRDTSLTSMVGFPRHVGGSLKLNQTPISSLDGIPQMIGGDAYLLDTDIHSLSGISKKVESIGGTVVIGGSQTHVLGLLEIRGVQQIIITSLMNGTDSPVAVILNKYIGTGDIISAQDELIDAGCKEQARL